MKAVEEKPNILLVDDRPENLLALHAVLKSEEYNLVDASSGDTALKHLMDRDFALIIMDVQMPGLSGFETAMLIKKRQRSEFVPIIFVTASVMTEMGAEQGYRVGAVDYIMKPFNPEALRAKAKFFAQYFEKHQKSMQQLELEKEFHQIIEVVSHDLKNPLGAIRLNVQVLERELGSASFDQLKESLRKKIDKINRSTGQMQSLIENLLDLSKFEGSKIHLEKEEVNIRKLVEEVVDILSIQADAKGIKIKNLIADGCTHLLCDHDRILQVFSNIIGNAIKFTPNNGKITISCSTKDGNVVFSIADTGAGIEPENLHHIFDKFWQAKSTAKKGTGLGLSIAKWIVEAHDGKIWATSEIGKGSNFCFRLPQPK